MLQRIEHANAVVMYQSPMLSSVGVLHGFSTRLGGVSRGAYASLNLGPLIKQGGDDNTNIAANFRKFRTAIGCKRHRRVTCDQVHGAAVWWPPAEPIKPADAPQADAILTNHAVLMLVIRTADCAPILLADKSGGVVAAVHAGWRGVVADVLGETVRAFSQRCNLAPGRLIAAIGPAISAAHFEVGLEVAQQFERAGLGDAMDRRLGGKPHIDLPRAAMMQLQRAGVDADRIDRTDRCTFRDEAEFFSHRRDQGVTGRHAAAIAPAG